MTSMQSQMYAFSGVGDPVIIIITTTITIIIITAITTSWCCASSWCFINDSKWMNPTWLWLRAKRPERRKAERKKKWGCFPSSSYPGKTQQASGKVYPNAFPRSWRKETQILLSSRSLCRASYLGRILYLLFWGPNYEPFRGLLSPTKLSTGRWDH